jgi:hypothetical protein
MSAVTTHNFAAALQRIEEAEKPPAIRIEEVKALILQGFLSSKGDKKKRISIEGLDNEQFKIALASSMTVMDYVYVAKVLNQGIEQKIPLNINSLTKRFALPMYFYFKSQTSLGTLIRLVQERLQFQAFQNFESSEGKELQPWVATPERSLAVPPQKKFPP